MTTKTTPKKPRKPHKPAKLDEATWAKLRARWEIGELATDLAREFGTTPYAISTKAKAEKWAVSRRVALQAVQDLTRERLDGLTAAPGPDAASDPMAVAVETKVGVVMAHRKMIARIRGVANDLIEVAEYQSAEIRARIEREPADSRGIVALTQLQETRALSENLRTLTNTTAQMIAMEREAFGIQAAEGPREETYEERLKRLLEQSKAK